MRLVSTPHVPAPKAKLMSPAEIEENLSHSPGTASGWFNMGFWTLARATKSHGQCPWTFDVDRKRHEFGTPRIETAQLRKPEGQEAQTSEGLETNLNY